MSIILTTSGKQTVTIEDKPFASGGEGAVHKIMSPASYKGYCAKLYFHQHRTKRREQKIEFMVKNPLPDTRGLRQGGCIICWPTELLYQHNRFVGFIMPKAFDHSTHLYALCTPAVRKLPTVWHSKYDRTTGSGIEARLKLCVNIAAAINFIHSQGKYVFVDLKPQNILITDDGRISLIDLDSIQIAHNSKVLFPAQVATPEYVPVEGNHINPSRDIIPESWDRFSLAVVFYELLFGLHPYAASYQGRYKDSSSVADSIKNGLFVFGSKKTHVYSRPPLHDNFSRLPDSIQRMFLRAFDDGHANPLLRPKAEEWGRLIFAEVIKFRDQVKGFQPLKKADKVPQPPARQTQTAAQQAMTTPAKTPAPGIPEGVKTALILLFIFFLFVVCGILGKC